MPLRCLDVASGPAGRGDAAGLLGVSEEAARSRSLLGGPQFETLRCLAAQLAQPSHRRGAAEQRSLLADKHRLQDGPLDLSRKLLTKEKKESRSPTRPSAEAARGPSGAPPRSQRAHPRALLPCEVCGKAFDRPSLLKRHMRTHTGERPHACEVCEKRFSTSSSLNTHRRIHSGEKPHACGVCGKRFTASSNLYYHRMTHTKEKPHKCSLCLKSFPTPGDLRSHQYVHSGAWPFRCSACGRGFSKQTNLRNHLFLHTGDKPHSCGVCGKKFALACNLRAHVKTHEEEPRHSDEVSTITSVPPSSAACNLSPSTAQSSTCSGQMAGGYDVTERLCPWDLYSLGGSTPATPLIRAPWSGGCSLLPTALSAEELRRGLLLEAHLLLSALNHRQRAQ